MLVDMLVLNKMKNEMSMLMASLFHCAPTLYRYRFPILYNFVLLFRIYGVFYLDFTNSYSMLLSWSATKQINH